MNFKELVQHDNTNVFINFDEFGELKDIDGEDVLIVVDGDLINERPQAPSYEDGTYQNKLTFFVREEELGYVPEQYQNMKIENYPYIVANVAKNMGILEVTIEANQT